MNTKKNRKKILLFLVIIVTFTLSFYSVLAASSYKNQEKIPGYDQTNDFPTYVKQIISFGFATIGILALFMIVIGAYQYLMAAGNIGKVDSAKETIGSALLGLILGLCAWIILYKINPDLVKMELSNISSSNSSKLGSGPSSYSGTAIAISGKTAERIANYDSIIKEASDQYGVPEYLIKSLIDTESSGNTYAKNPNSTATGLMQLVRGTANDMGVTDATDPYQNIMGGTKYLSQMYSYTGNNSWEDALYAYNQGPGAWKKTGSDWASGNASGVSYVNKVMGKSLSYSPST